MFLSPKTRKAFAKNFWLFPLFLIPALLIGGFILAAIVFILILALIPVEDDKISLNDLATWDEQGIGLRKGKGIGRRVGEGGLIGVVGESHYQKTLRRFKNYFPWQEEERNIVASLIPEPDNKHDKNAVKVEIGKELVGYLSRQDALTFGQSHTKAIAENKRIQCNGKLIGGTWGKSNVGVLLFFTIEEEIRYKRKPPSLL